MGCTIDWVHKQSLVLLRLLAAALLSVNTAQARYRNIGITSLRGVQHVVRGLQCSYSYTENRPRECRDLLVAPVQEAKRLLQGRIPVPKLLECDQGGSQVRIPLRICAPYSSNLYAFHIQAIRSPHLHPGWLPTPLSGLAANRACTPW